MTIMNHFKRFAVFALFLAVACGSLNRTPQEEQEEARLVQEKLDARNYRIDIDYMIPLREGSRLPLLYWRKNPIFTRINNTLNHEANRLLSGDSPCRYGLC